MPSELKVAAIQSKTGTAAITIADGGVLTLDKVANQAFPAGHVIKVQSFFLASDHTQASTTYGTAMTQAFTPDGGANNTSTIYGYFYMSSKSSDSAANALQKLKYTITGDDIANVAESHNKEVQGFYITGNTSNIWMHSVNTMSLRPVTLNGAGNANITFTISVGTESANGQFILYGDGTGAETHLQVWEVV